MHLDSLFISCSYPIIIKRALSLIHPFILLSLPHGKVEHKARTILDPALYSERYIKQTRTSSRRMAKGGSFRHLIWMAGQGAGWWPFL